MPKLRSGRMVGVGDTDLAAILRTGSDEQALALCVAYRLQVRGPQDLLGLMPVVEFDPATGPPPRGVARPSGFTVGELLAGRAKGWADDELAEFRQWLQSNKAIHAWARETFDEVDAAIREHPMWMPAADPPLAGGGGNA